MGQKFTQQLFCVKKLTAKGGLYREILNLAHYLHLVVLFFACKAKAVTLCVGLAAFKLFGSAVLWKTGTFCRPSALTWFSNTGHKRVRQKNEAK